MKWSDVRSDWPAEKINLYGPGTDSGTFDYFTEAVNGEAGSTRKDYTPSEDDNVLVQGIAGDKYAMGYFGFAYYEENMDKLNVVAVDNGAGAIVPTMETIMDGSYAPLSRPLFMYVSKKSLANAHVKTFVDYFMTTGTTLISSVGYVPLTDADYEKERAKLG
jgi:phosphate transport system substrate-binding protein